MKIKGDHDRDRTGGRRTIEPMPKAMSATSVTKRAVPMIVASTVAGGIRSVPKNFDTWSAAAGAWPPLPEAALGVTQLNRARVDLHGVEQRGAHAGAISAPGPRKNAMNDVTSETTSVTP